MDITTNFMKCVQTIHHNNTDINDILSFNRENKNQNKCVTTNDNKNNYKSNDFEKKIAKKNSDFNVKVCNIIKFINEIKSYLLNNRKDYINIYSPLLSLASTMTDSERDQIDEDVERIIKICYDNLKLLKIEAKGVKNAQKSQHQTLVIDLIERYLKIVCGIHSEQKAIRIKRAIEKQRFIRLSNNIMTKNERNSKLRKNDNLIENKKSDVSSNISVKSSYVDNYDAYKTEHNYNRPETIHVIETTNDDNSSGEQLKLSKEEIQIFEEESKLLYNHMNSMSDEVQQIEGKVIEIAKLQEIFSEKVIQQEYDMNRVSEKSITSTENIRGGNEQLREAMKKNAGFRVWVLFFIITLSFTILFLDWYND